MFSYLNSPISSLASSVTSLLSSVTRLLSFIHRSFSVGGLIHRSFSVGGLIHRSFPRLPKPSVSSSVGRQPIYLQKPWHRWTANCHCQLQLSSVSRLPSIIPHIPTANCHCQLPLSPVPGHRSSVFFTILLLLTTITLSLAQQPTGLLQTQKAIDFYQQQKLDSSITYYKKALRLNTLNNNPDYAAANANDLGVIMFKNGNYDSARHYYSNALKHYTNTHDSVNMAYLHLNIGMTYKATGEYEIALGQSLIAVKLMEHKGLNATLGSAYSTVGNIYLQLNLFDKAILYHKQALVIHNEKKDIKRIAMACNNIGNAFNHLEAYDSALFYYEKSLEVKKKLKNDLLISSTLNNIGELLIKTKKYTGAHEKFDETLAIKKKLNDRPGQLITLNALGRLNLLMKNYPKAFSYIREADALIEEVASLRAHKEHLKVKIDYFKATGELHKAVSTSELYEQIKDSLLNEEMAENLAEMQVKYESEKKQKEITILQQDRQLKEAAIKQNENSIRTLTLSVVFTIIIAALLFRNAQLTRKSKRKIEVLFSELQHRTKNNLQIISSMLNLQANRLKDVKSREALHSGKARVNAMVLIHKKLYARGMVKELNMKEYISEIIQHLTNTFGFDNRNLKLDLAIENIILNIDNAIALGLIVNEIISNSFKHAYHNVPSPELLITLQKENDEVELIIKDNGPGIPGNLHQLNNDSLGLTIINLLVSNLKGKIQMQYLYGTMWTLKFKIKTLKNL